MDMTVDHIAFRLMIPCHKRIVKQHQLTLAVRKFRVRLDSGEIFCKCGIAYPSAVVIPDNKAFFAFQKFQNSFGIFMLKEHISQNENGIVTANPLVPRLYHKRFHIACVLKRTTAQVYYTFVTEMRIGNKPDHFLPPVL